MRKICFLISLFLLPFYASSIDHDKARIIVMTDLGGTDPDDIQSLIHLLVCADRFDIEGLISSQAWIDDSDHTDCIRNIIRNYCAVYPNLSRHASSFPTPEKLYSLTMRGQEKPHISGIGEGKDSDGSELIIKVLTDNNDNRPVWITAWGGMNTMAQAIWKASKTLSKNQFETFKSKIRIYDILGQDDAGAWIASNYPDIIYIRNKEVYGWAPDDSWTYKNIQSVGDFGKFYPNRIWATEGDSPSFMYVYSNGLNAPEHIDWGGWGGRFSTEKQKNIRGMDFIESSGKSEKIYDDYFMYGSSTEGVYAINKWKEHIYNDFAARMIWSTTPDYDKANHHPIVITNGHNHNTPLFISVKSGDNIILDSSNSSDPDNDKISFLWQIYKEPGTFNGKIVIEDTLSPICKINVPAETIETGTLHIILTVTDNGIPALTSYKRIVLEINQSDESL